MIPCSQGADFRPSAPATRSDVPLRSDIPLSLGGSLVHWGLSVCILGNLEQMRARPDMDVVSMNAMLQVVPA